MPGELTRDWPAISDNRPLPAETKLQTTRAVTLAVRQIKGTHIDAFARDVQAALDGLKGVLPGDLQIERTHNEPAEVEEKVRQFDKNLMEAVAIVVLVAMVFMEWRTALLVAASIPLTCAMTLGICQLLGIDLQQVSIAAMIIALGLLVDDPVVAGDAINRELAHGQPRDVAAWLGPQKLARAILYATVTNCVAFLPLLLVRGKTGEFIYSLPVVVTAALVSSRIVSMTFMPLLGYYVLRGQKGMESGADAKGWTATVARGYRGFAGWCLNHKAVTLTTCALALCCRCGPAALVGHRFLSQGLARRIQRERLSGRRLAHPPDPRPGPQGHPRHRGIGRRQGPLLHDVRRPGRAAVLALDRAGTAGRELRPDPRTHVARARHGASGGPAEARAAARRGGRG